MNLFKHKAPKTGDVYLNPYFGDLWIVQGSSFIKINEGTRLDLDEPEGFVFVGHLKGITTRIRRDNNE